MDPYGPPTRWIDIYSRASSASSAITFNVCPSFPWIKAYPSTGTVDTTGNNTDTRVQLSVDWSNPLQVPTYASST
jgi:hypothetical protein